MNADVAPVWRAKLCDFASSVIPGEEENWGNGVVLEIEPRALRSEVAMTKSRTSLTTASDDCFSFGVTIFVALRGEHPRAEANQDDPWFCRFDGITFSMLLTTHRETSAERSGNGETGSVVKLFWMRWIVWPHCATLIPGVE